LFPYLKEIICLDTSENFNEKMFRYKFLEHHDCHSALSYHRSGFSDSEALCISLDGGGSFYATEVTEDEIVLCKECSSIIYRKGINEVQYIERVGVEAGRTTPNNISSFLLSHYKNELRSKYSYGWAFSIPGRYIFKQTNAAGKMMGLSAYGKPNNILDEDKAFIEWEPNRSFFKDAEMAYKLGEVSAEDIAYKIQKESGDAVIKYVKRALEYKPDVKNVCCSGGFFYNIINNQKLIKEFPHINFYFEPMCGDVGLATGAALNEYYRLTEDTTKRPIKTLYMGTQANYDRDLREGETEYKVTPAEVAKLIEERNVVAIYQGKAEAGPRALGNRSILYDPRDPNGRDRVNEIKKREKFRPFAGTVMEEHASEWFDMMNQKSSPYMMIAFDTLPEKKDLVPALQHNDGTSRIQTVNREQNNHYYDLINEFYKLTGVPMVLNTSFNLAGDTMVDNMQDAFKTCREGSIPYLYCPEREMIIDFTANL
jgi:carbamoyltransferase